MFSLSLKNTRNSFETKKIDKAKDSVQFAALNYMYTGEGIDLVADYISRSNDDLNNKLDIDTTFY